MQPITKTHVMKKILIAAFLLSSIISCKKKTDEQVTPTATPVKINVTPTVSFQTISGFGGANRMWGSQSLTPAEAQKAFGTAETELGLSLFRVRLSSNKTEWPIIIEAVKEANKRGVQVLASPWSPPPALKDNGSDIRGRLLPQNYTAFKNYINEFLTFMTNNGAKIDVVSIQNEPDYPATYESCDWTATEMINFLNAPGQITGAKVAAPESLNFNQAFTNALLNNDAASQKIDIVAGHLYGGGLARFPLAEQKKKEIWMTEFLLNLNTGNAGAPKWATLTEAAKWGETLQMLNSIHDAMSNNWNAYIWWYLQRYYSFLGDGEEGTTNGAVLKRGFAFAHFSKFVRPGYIRIGTESTLNFYLKVTAYRKDNQTVLVIINPENFEIKNVQIGGTSGTATSYTTSSQLTMDKKTIPLTNQAFTLNIPSQSVTTIVINN